MPSDTTRPLLGTTYVVRAFGCQMNLHDAVRVRGHARGAGSLPVEAYEDADIVVFITCCVREAADTRLYGQVATMRTLPCARARLLAAHRRRGRVHRPARRRLAVRQPPQRRRRVSAPTRSRAWSSWSRASSTAARTTCSPCSMQTPPAGLDRPAHPSRGRTSTPGCPSRSGATTSAPTASCPTCAGASAAGSSTRLSRRWGTWWTPAARRSRSSARTSTPTGATSMGRRASPSCSAPAARPAFHASASRRATPRTCPTRRSRPWRRPPAVMPALHLPVQSGSTRILKKMNRTYTREGLPRPRRPHTRRDARHRAVHRRHRRLPGRDPAKDFEQTLSLVEEVGYAQTFTFIYSKREGTPAATMPDDTPREIIQQRFDRLVESVQRCAFDANQPELGKTLPVLFEGLFQARLLHAHGPQPQEPDVHAPLPAGPHRRRAHRQHPAGARRGGAHLVSGGSLVES